MVNLPMVVIEGVEGNSVSELWAGGGVTSGESPCDGDRGDKGEVSV